MIGFGGAETIDHVNGSGEQHAVAAKTGGMAERGRQMGFADTG